MRIVIDSITQLMEYARDVSEPFAPMPDGFVEAVDYFRDEREYWRVLDERNAVATKAWMN